MAALAAALPGRSLAVQQWLVLLGISAVNLLNIPLMLRRSKREPEAAAGWRLLVLSQVVSVAINGLTAFYPDSRQNPPWVEWGQLATLLVIGLIQAVALMRWPWRRKIQAAPHQRTLGVLLFASSLMLLFWYLGLWTAGLEGGTINHFRLLCLAMRSVFTGGIALYLIAEIPARARGPLGWVMASHGAWLVFMMTIQSFLRHSGMEGFPAYLFALVLLPPLLLTQAVASSERVEPAQGSPAGPAFELLPYVPYLLSGGALAVMGACRRNSLALPLSGFLLVTVFLLLRQWMLLREVEAANVRLEERVSQRTRELEESQKVLLRTERMNTTALLGAGLAHDLNNLLSVIAANADAIEQDLTEHRTPPPEYIQRVQQAVHRAGAMTRRIMAYAREGEAEPVPIDLAEHLMDCRDLLTLVLGRAGRLELELPGYPIDIRASAHRLEQVLVNLVANARDVIAPGGVVAIRAVRADREGRPYARLTVSDTGAGMTPDVLTQVFDPFFTTKNQGRGIGLGLATLKVLVEGADGFITVASEPGKGTTFTLDFPEIPLGG